MLHLSNMPTLNALLFTVNVLEIIEQTLFLRTLTINILCDSFKILRTD